MRAGSRILAAVLVLAAGAVKAYAASTCPEEQATRQVPADLAKCAMLEKDVRRPSAFPLNVYEDKLIAFFGAMCHRNEKGGWVRDKSVRDTGPWIGTYAGGQWSGRYFGTHSPVVIWYSPDMLAWLHANRPEGRAAPKNPAPIPDGAMMVKEMYQPPAAACAAVDPLKLKPVKNGAAIMIRDHKASNDGWFWGWYGFGKDSGWTPDWPAASTSPSPNMGFGQYCTNCHASAKDNQTFADLKNINGEPGIPLVFLSQNFFLDPSWEVQSEQIAQSAEPSMNVPSYDQLFLATFKMPGGMPDPKAITLPPSTYDNVWVKSGKPDAASEYVTSDQCFGCHSAGGTGLQFDMTEPGPDGLLVNVSPYGGWRGSPMGLAGRDPVFYAQLASETDTFHPGSKAMVQDTCLGCHGILGQRQYGIDSVAKGGPKGGQCDQFPREAIDAKPYKPDNPLEHLARYGALARDGISCAACHRMVMGKADTAKFEHAPQNKCVLERQAALNPGFKDFGKTFTGSFLVGSADKLYGPFPDPKTVPMDHALGNLPEHNANILQSETCGSCHTVHLPIMHPEQTIGHVYEQTTYPEWAFSDYRTGETPDGKLPYGKGPRAQSCQACHMHSTAAGNKPYRSKIASIQEYSNFPQTENTRPPQEIDLPVRAGFAKHTLVGLNVFLLKMAQQFFETLGIREADPMLTQKGVNPLPETENAMLDQALNRTAKISVSGVHSAAGALSARVTVENLSGHKFPSGVGFRRAFVEFDVLDASGAVLWSSGRTNSTGVILGQRRQTASRRILVEGRLLGAHRPGQAHPSAALPGDREPGSGADLSGARLDAAGRFGRDVRRACGAARRAHHELPVDLRQGEGQPPAAERLPGRESAREYLLRTRRRQGHGRGSGRDGRGQRSGLCPWRRRQPDLSRAARGIAWKAGLGEGNALLPGDAALFPAGSVLHVQERRHQAAVLRGGEPEVHQGADPGLEA